MHLFCFSVFSLLSSMCSVRAYNINEALLFVAVFFFFFSHGLFSPGSFFLDSVENGLINHLFCRVESCIGSCNSVLPEPDRQLGSD